MRKRKFYCKICKKNTKKEKEDRCPICLDFRGREDYRNFVLGSRR